MLAKSANRAGGSEEGEALVGTDVHSFVRLRGGSARGLEARHHRAVAESYG
jgi:hypothetical protein